MYRLRDTVRGDLLKYGDTKDLWQRLFANYVGAWGGKTTQYIHGKLFTEGWLDRVEVAWCDAPDATQAKLWADALTAAHERTHGRRPLWDRTGPRIRAAAS